ncbi:metal-dependent hydrolase family protein [Halogeometricum limi]|uniref:Imidazolonepropionase n=1 Tax=Halogeometricum limi TaxID=555875 RepID=A0A1I6ITZ9_9EURY|nr:amidohydrolase family protein [Halogeometricum limi]SFR70207.1 Imidazolonepropionase [Halogeometricum limi]
MILRDVTLVDRGETRTGAIAFDEETETITAVGDAETVLAETDDGDDAVRSLPGYAVLPGLVDAHVHFSLSGERSVEDVVGMTDAELALAEARNARRTLESGVTGVRVMGARDVDVHVRDAIEAGDVPGPRTVANCRSITVTGGHGHHLGREITGADDARRAVREQVKLGADFIKFMTTGGVTTPGSDPHAVAMTEAEVHALVDEAHRRGVHAATHVHGAAGARVALEAGVDTVEHGTFLDEETVELFAAHDATLVPTLSAPYHIVRNIETATEDAARKTRDVYERHLESFEMAVDAGVRIAGGTDAGTPFNYHGANATEVEFMAKYGMSAEEAIRAMTQTAADVVGLEGSGTLEPGTYADLLVVEGDPTEDLTRLNHPTAVLKGGAVVSGSLPAE